MKDGHVLGGSRLAILTTVILMLVVAGCEGQLDRLLEVERPGQIGGVQLENPALAEAWSAGVQGDFECAFSAYNNFFALWSGMANQAGAQAFQTEQRAFYVTQYDRACEGAGGVSGPFAGLQMARSEAQSFVAQVSTFSEIRVPRKQELMARARLYEAYSILLLTEGYCAFVMDAGPVMTRVEGFQLAEDRFRQALEYANEMTNAVAASNVRNAALIGRARAGLNLWSLKASDGSSVVSDASKVADGFVFYAAYESGQGGRRSNRMYSTATGGWQWFGPKLRPLRFLGGIPDPRVRLVLTTVFPTGGSVPGWVLKYVTSEGDDVPIGTWREAKLMIAEVRGGQTAVDIINELRATVTKAPYVPAGNYGLPTFSSTNPTEIQAAVRQERIRETFAMGTHMGDLMRWRGQSLILPYDDFARGVPEQRTGQYNDEASCLPFPDFETIGNPNIDQAAPYPTKPL
ncbi:MAG: hypothetical protein EXR93_12720 [Gemmatimonadetes bacterium]|nr:hypothetical protein [Gemmatimonadota bacterium]